MSVICKPPLLFTLYLFLSFIIGVTANGEVIYQNTVQRLGTAAFEAREFGDQVELVGDARVVTDFLFEYHGDFTASGDETVRVRFYTNEEQLGPFRKRPTTLIYDSGAKGVAPGFGKVVLSGLAVFVPDTFTFTVEFGGVSMEPGDRIGLLLFGFPETGMSYNEFWGRTPSGDWQAFAYRLDNGIPNPENPYRANAGVKIIAAGVPPAANIAGVSMDGAVPAIRFPTTPGKYYRLEYRERFASDSPWKRVHNTEVKASSFSVTLRDPGAGQSATRFYRVVTSDDPSPTVSNLAVSGGSATMASYSIPGMYYTLEYRDGFGRNFRWRPVPGSGIRATGKTVALADQNRSTTGMRFYRVVAKATSIELTDESVTVTSFATAGKRYALEYTTNFNTWTREESTTSLGNTVTFAMPQNRTRLRFYRVVEI